MCTMRSADKNCCHEVKLFPEKTKNGNVNSNSKKKIPFLWLCISQTVLSKMYLDMWNCIKYLLNEFSSK